MADRNDNPPRSDDAAALRQELGLVRDELQRTQAALEASRLFAAEQALQRDEAVRQVRRLEGSLTFRLSRPVRAVLAGVRRRRSAR
jgi:hypothetical protein